MCHTRVHVRACVRVCACACVINENKHAFQDFRYFINDTVLVYQLNCHSNCHVGLLSSIFYAQLTWRHVEPPIKRFNCNRRSSLM